MATLYVGTGEGCYATIQAAVNAAKEIAGKVTIEIAAGEYTENVTFGARTFVEDGTTYVGGITFKAAEGADVTVNGYFQCNGVAGDLKDIVFDGLTINNSIRNGGYFAPIMFGDNYSGKTASGIVVQNCTLNSSTGTASGTTSGVALTMGLKCDGVTIANNVINAECGFYGGDGNLISNTSIVGNTMNGSAEESTYNYWGMVYIYNCGSGNEVIGNTIDTSAMWAVRVRNGEGIVLADNVITDCQGVNIVNGSVVSNNTVDGETLTYPAYEGNGVFVLGNLAGTAGQEVLINGKLYTVGEDVFDSFLTALDKAVAENATLEVLGSVTEDIPAEAKTVTLTQTLEIKGTGTVTLNNGGYKKLIFAGADVKIAGVELVAPRTQVIFGIAATADDAAVPANVEIAADALVSAYVTAVAEGSTVNVLEGGKFFSTGEVMNVQGALNASGSADFDANAEDLTADDRQVVAHYMWDYGTTNLKNNYSTVYSQLRLIGADSELNLDNARLEVGKTVAGAWLGNPAANGVGWIKLDGAMTLDNGSVLLASGATGGYGLTLNKGSEFTVANGSEAEFGAGISNLGTIAVDGGSLKAGTEMVAFDTQKPSLDVANSGDIIVSNGGAFEANNVSNVALLTIDGFQKGAARDVIVAFTPAGSDTGTNLTFTLGANQTALNIAVDTLPDGIYNLTVIDGTSVFVRQNVSVAGGNIYVNGGVFTADSVSVGQGVFEISGESTVNVASLDGVANVKGGTLTDSVIGGTVAVTGDATFEGTNDFSNLWVSGGTLTVNGDLVTKTPYPAFFVIGNDETVNATEKGFYNGFIGTEDGAMIVNGSYTAEEGVVSNGGTLTVNGDMTANCIYLRGGDTTVAEGGSLTGIVWGGVDAGASFAVNGGTFVANLADGMGSFSNAGTFTVSGNSSIQIANFSSGIIEVADGTSLTDTVIAGAGTVKLAGTVNFYGSNSIAAVENTVFDIVVNKNASLVIARANNVWGYGRDVTVYGVIEDATALESLDGVTLSLKADSSSGFSVGGTGTHTLTVEDAYIDLASTSWKNAKGTYTWNFSNSYVKAASFLNCNAAGSDSASWEITFDDSVLAASSHFKSGKGVEINFTNGSVANVSGSMRMDGVLNIDATSSVTVKGYFNAGAAGAASEHSDILGTLNIAGSMNIKGTGSVELLGGAVNVIDGGTLNLVNDNGSRLDVLVDADSELNVDGSFTAGTINNNGEFAISGNSTVDVTLIKGNDVTVSGTLKDSNIAFETFDWETGNAIVDGELVVDGGTFKNVQFRADEGEKVTLAGDVVAAGATQIKAVNGEVVVNGSFTGSGSTIEMEGDDARLTITENAKVDIAEGFFLNGGTTEITGTLADDADLTALSKADAQVKGAYSTWGSTYAADVTLSDTYVWNAMISINNADTVVTLDNSRLTGWMSFDITAGTLTVTNGSYVDHQAAEGWTRSSIGADAAIVLQDGSTFNAAKSALTNNGSITIDGSSSLVAKTLAGTGSITIDAAGFTEGLNKVIDLSGSTSLEGSVTIENLEEGTQVYYLADGDVILSNAAVDTLYISSDWAGKEFGATVGNGMYFGINAFAAMDDAVALLDGNDITIALLSDAVLTADSNYKLNVISGNGEKHTLQINSVIDVDADFAKEITLDAPLFMAYYNNHEVVVNGDLKGGFYNYIGSMTFNNSKITDSYDNSNIGGVVTINGDGSWTLENAQADNLKYINIGRSDWLGQGILNLNDTVVKAISYSVDSNSAVAKSQINAVNSTIATVLNDGMNGHLTVGTNGEVNLTDSNLDIVGTLTNNGTVNMTGEGYISAKVAGNGWINMDSVTLDENTNIQGGKIRFNNGESTLDGATINGSAFQVGFGAYVAKDERETVADIVVNVTNNSYIHTADVDYNGWVGTGWFESDADKAAAMTDARYTLNIKNSVAEFGYFHVSTDGILNVTGNAAEKKTYTGVSYSYRGGRTMINGVATFDNVDALVLYTNVSCDNGTETPGKLVIKNGANYVSYLDSSSDIASFKISKTGIVEVDNATLDARHGTLLDTADAKLTIKNNGIFKGYVVTNNGTITVDGAQFNATTVTNAGTFTVTGESTIQIGTYSNGSGKQLRFENATLVGDSNLGGNAFAFGETAVEGTLTLKQLNVYGSFTIEENAQMAASIVIVDDYLKLAENASLSLKYLNVDGTADIAGAVNVTNDSRSNFSTLVRDGGTVNLAATGSITGETYNGKVNEGGTLNINGGSVTFTKYTDGRAGKFQNDGTVNMTAGGLNAAEVINNGTLNLTANAAVVASDALTNAGSITIDCTSLLTAGSITNNGTITVDAAGFDGTWVKVIDVDSAITGNNVVLANGSGYYLSTAADGDIYLYKSPETIYVNCDYNSSTEGWGYNRFGSINSAENYAVTYSPKATVIVEKTTTVSGNSFQIIGSKNESQNGLKFIIKDGALAGNANSKWDMVATVTVEAGGKLVTSRPLTASAGYVHAKDTLTLAGDKENGKYAILDFGKGTHNSIDFATLGGGKVVADYADATFGDFSLQAGSASFTDSVVTVEGALSTGVGILGKLTLTGTTVNVNGHHSRSDSYFKGFNQLKYVTMTDSAIVIDDGAEDTVADNVTLHTVTMTDSEISVEAGTDVEVTGKVTMNDESLLSAGKITLAKGSNITMDIESTIEFTSIVTALEVSVEGIKNVGGTITVKTDDYVSGNYNIFDYVGDGEGVSEDNYKYLLGEENWHDNYKVLWGDLYLTDQNTATIYVNAAWNGSENGDTVGEGYLYGYNAFSSFGEIVVAEDTTKLMIAGGTYSSKFNTTSGVSVIGGSIAEVEAEGDVVVNVGSLVFETDLAGVVTVDGNFTTTDTNTWSYEHNMMPYYNGAIQFKGGADTEFQLNGNFNAAEGFTFNAGKVVISETSAVTVNDQNCGQINVYGEVVNYGAMTVDLQKGSTLRLVNIGNGGSLTLSGDKASLVTNIVNDQPWAGAQCVDFYISNGTLNVEDGASVDASGIVEIYKDGAVTLDGGSFSAGTVLFKGDNAAVNVTGESEVAIGSLSGIIDATDADLTMDITGVAGSQVNVFGDSSVAGTISGAKLVFGSVDKSVNATVDVTGFTQVDFAAMNGSVTITGQMAEGSFGLAPMLISGLYNNNNQDIRGDVAVGATTVTVAEDAYVTAHQIYISESEAANKHVLNVYGEVKANASIFNKYNGELNVYGTVSANYLQVAGNVTVTGEGAQLNLAGVGGNGAAKVGLAEGGSKFIISNGAKVDADGAIAVGYSGRTGDMIVENATLEAAKVTVATGASFTVKGESTLVINELSGTLLVDNAVLTDSVISKGSVNIKDKNIFAGDFNASYAYVGDWTNESYTGSIDFGTDSNVNVGGQMIIGHDYSAMGSNNVVFGDVTGTVMTDKVFKAADVSVRRDGTLTIANTTGDNKINTMNVMGQVVIDNAKLSGEVQIGSTGDAYNAEMIVRNGAEVTLGGSSNSVVVLGKSQKGTLSIDNASVTVKRCGAGGGYKVPADTFVIGYQGGKGYLNLTNNASFTTMDYNGDKEGGEVNVRAYRGSEINVSSNSTLTVAGTLGVAGALTVDGANLTAKEVSMFSSVLFNIAQGDAREIVVSFIPVDATEGVTVRLQAAKGATTVTYEGTEIAGGTYYVTVFDGDTSVRSEMVVEGGSFDVKGESTLNIATLNGYAALRDGAELSASKVGGLVKVFGAASLSGDNYIASLNVGSGYEGAVSLTVNGAATFANVEVGNGTLTIAEGAQVTANSNTFAAGATVVIDNADYYAREVAVAGSVELSNGALLRAEDVFTVAADGRVELDTASSISFAGAFANAGVITVDMNNADDTIFRVIDYTGTGAMTLAAYGNLTTADGFEFVVKDNDLYVVTEGFDFNDLMVNGLWTGSEDAEALGNGRVYGLNGFASLDQIADNGVVSGLSKITVANTDYASDITFADEGLPMELTNTSFTGNVTVTGAHIELDDASFISSITAAKGVHLAGEGSVGNVQGSGLFDAKEGITVGNATSFNLAYLSDMTVSGAFTMTDGSDELYVNGDITVGTVDFLQGSADKMVVAAGATVDAGVIESSGKLTIDMAYAGETALSVTDNGAFATNSDLVINLTAFAADADGVSLLVSGIDAFSGSVVLNGESVSLNESVIFNNNRFVLSITGEGLALVEAVEARNDLDNNGLSDILLWNADNSNCKVLLTTGNDAPAFNELVLGDFDRLIGAGKVTGADVEGPPVFYQDGNAVKACIMGEGNVAEYRDIWQVADNGAEVVGLGDFNGDGATDLLVEVPQSADGGVAVGFISNGEWNYFQSLGAEWDVTHVGDFNNDGRDDVMLENAEGFAGAWLIKEDGTPEWAGLDSISSVETCGVGDFNGDGIDDVLVRNGEWVGAWIVGTDGDASNGLVDSFIGIKGDLAVENTIEQIGDFNGDGVDDIVIRTAAGDLGVLSINGDSTDWKYFTTVSEEWKSSIASL